MWNDSVPPGGRLKLEILSAEDLDRIDKASVSILAGYGVAFSDCSAALQLFEANGCSVDGGRVRIPEAVLREALDRLPDRNTITHFVAGHGISNEIGLKQGESHFGLIGNAYYIYDYKKGESRNCVEADQPQKLLVHDSLSDIEFDCCNLFYASERDGSHGNPSSRVESASAYLHDWVIGRSGLDVNGIPMAHPRVTEDQHRLALLGLAVISGSGTRTEDLIAKNDSTMVWCNPISPLQYHPGEAENIINVARSDRRFRMVMISPEVMLGATGPVTIAGALVQHTAEVLAGTVLAQLANPGTPVLFGCVSAPMDLRNAEISQGNFETAMINGAAVQIADMYGMPSRIAPGNTSDNKTSERAAVEAAVGLYIGAAAGGNYITTGLLDSTLMISYEHLVLVDEMIRQVKSISGGINTDPESLGVETIIADGHPSPDFLQSDHTLGLMNRDIYYSPFTGRIKESYLDWYERAHERVKDILDTDAAETAMTPEIRERLVSVQERLDRDDETWRIGTDGWWREYIAAM